MLTRWLDLKSAPALAMLPRYWEYSARLPQNFRFPLYAASGLAVVVAVAPLFIILAVLFAKPKRELHGSARFANGAEIAQTGLFNKTNVAYLAIPELKRTCSKTANTCRIVAVHRLDNLLKQ